MYVTVFGQLIYAQCNTDAQCTVQQVKDTMVTVNISLHYALLLRSLFAKIQSVALKQDEDACMSFM